MVNWFKHPQYIPDEVKTLSEAEAAYALREAWYRVYGQYPSDRSLAVLWAKSALETWRWKHIHCYNFGNIKRKPNDTQPFTMFECGEEISLSQAQKLVAEDPERIKILKTYTWSNGSKRASINVLPGHEWSQFRAFNTVEDGAEDYLRFVSQEKRYVKAWQKVVEGDPAGYSHELKRAGYYTGSEITYTTGVMRLFKEFLGKKDELMSWKSDEKDTDPSPPPVSEIPEEDVHDTDHDIKPPVQDPEELVDTVVSNTIPEPKPEDKSNGNMFAIIAIALGGFGTFIMWLLQAC